VTDPRIDELEALAREESITLPLPVDLILFLEDRGRIVDLVTGEVLNAVTVKLEASGKAVAHLLEHVEGEYPL
jgi:hypothetical protein